MRLIASEQFTFDLGTQNTLLMGEKKTINAYVPSVVFVDPLGATTFVGEDALLHQSDLSIMMATCLHRGHIVDRQNVLMLLESVLSTVKRPAWAKLLPVPCIVAVSSTFAPTDAAVYKEVFRSVGFLPIFVPSSVGIAAAVHVKKKAAVQLVLDCGASKLEIAVINAGQLGRSAVLCWGGEALDHHIQSSLVVELETIFPLRDVRTLKHMLSPLKAANDASHVLRGKHTKTGKVVSVRLTSAHLSRPTQQWLSIVTAWIQTFLAELPAGVLSALSQEGLVISGGLSQLQGLERTLEETLSLKVTSISRPQVASGMGLQTLHAQSQLLEHRIAI